MIDTDFIFSEIKPFRWHCLLREGSFWLKSTWMILYQLVSDVPPNLQQEAPSANCKHTEGYQHQVGPAEQPTSFRSPKPLHKASREGWSSAEWLRHAPTALADHTWKNRRKWHQFTLPLPEVQTPQGAARLLTLSYKRPSESSQNTVGLS